ncbi:collagen-like protein, partial [Streptococcus pneumoniae]|nr:collagen-like protein [Streptococcus pneumoniae]
CYILRRQQVPQGFRSKFSLIGGIYNDKGTPYGTWYLGGVSDSNMLLFQFTDPVPTDRDIGDIRVSAIYYLTSDPWPERLP